MAKPTAQARGAEFSEQIRAATKESFEAQARRDALAEQRVALLPDGSDDAIAAVDKKLQAEQLRLDRAEARIAKLKKDRAAVDEAEGAERLKSHFDAVRARADALNKQYPEMRKLLTTAAIFLNEQAAVYELLGNANRNPPPGEEPIEPPGLSFRYSPAPTLANLPMRMFSRLKEEVKNMNSSGDARYENFEAREETPAFGGEPAFDPRPLHHTLEIPSMCKGDPSYRIPAHLKW
jgi:hypothetical protein